MKASELRIGNFVLVKDRDNFSFQVNEDSISNFAKGNLEIRHVPLTEEWLLKFGFNKNNMMGETNFNKGGLYISDDFIFVYYHGNRVYLKYVHQLQNLYFALTGDELISM